MEFGWLSIVPPLLSITMALVSKKVIPSLLLGAFSGTLILQGWNPLTAVGQVVGLMWEKVTDGWNLSILIFLVFLGVLVHLVTMAGGSARYGQWAASRIKSREGAQFATFVLGILIFIDDYFNALTVGTVMKPVTDKFRISRAKLAFIIDATAAPICIIAPVSSWVVTVMSTIGDKFRAEGIGLDPFVAFLQVIPYNLYALLTLAFVAALCFLDLEFGPMARYEHHAIKTGNVHGPTGEEQTATNFSAGSERGTIWDLVVPIAGLVLFTVLAMIYTGGYFAGGISVLDAIKDTDAAAALKIGGFWALILSLVMFVPRGVVKVQQLPEAAVKGVRSMLPAIAILICAWTIGGVIGELGTGIFLANQLGASLPVFVYPAILFALAGIIAFSTGTSWGTFAIMIPIAIDFAMVLNPQGVLLMIAAVLAGSVYGDHCSPISDTTILSSTGAQCNHIEHVTTQLPYATFVAVISFVGYVISGLLVEALGQNFWTSVLSLVVAIVILIAALKVAHLRYGDNEPNTTFPG